MKHRENNDRGRPEKGDVYHAPKGTLNIQTNTGVTDCPRSPDGNGWRDPTCPSTFVCVARQRPGPAVHAKRQRCLTGGAGFTAVVRLALSPRMVGAALPTPSAVAGTGGEPSGNPALTVDPILTISLARHGLLHLSRMDLAGSATRNMRTVSAVLRSKFQPGWFQKRFQVKPGLSATNLTTLRSREVSDSGFPPAWFPQRFPRKRGWRPNRKPLLKLDPVTQGYGYKPGYRLQLGCTPCS